MKAPTQKARLQEVAARIEAHLRRFELDPIVNVLDEKYSTRPYYNAGAAVEGRKVRISYVSYQTKSKLDLEDALKYLAWLDAGNVGPHYTMKPSS